jgi:hypothetical protein
MRVRKFLEGDILISLIMVISCMSVETTESKSIKVPSEVRNARLRCYRLITSGSVIGPCAVAATPEVKPPT